MALISLEGISSFISGASASLAIFNYLAYEQSVLYGEPEELYLFNKDDTDFWTYTSASSDILHDGKTYEAVLIRRGDITLDSNALKTQLQIDVNLSNPFVRNFIIQPLEGVIQLTIYRRHVDSYVVYWQGYVQGVKFKSKTATIVAGLKTSSLKRLGLIRKFQRGCGFPLYSYWCTISKTDASYYISGTILSVSGTIITATIFGTKVDDWLLGGIFKTDNGNCLQKIVYHVDTTIKIAHSISLLAVGDTFVAWAGCNHLKATCKTKFSNKLNYGGQPYLPDKNPFVGDAVI